MIALRPLRSGDAPHIRRIFRDTLVLGRPLAFEVPDFDAYEDLALGWYLGAGMRGCAVAEDDGRIVGYVLVCTEQARFERWQRAAALRFGRRILPALALRRYPPQADRFYRLRLRDGWDLWRRGPRAGACAHAHVNLAAGSRDGLIIRDLVEHIDRVCADAGIDEWLGEMNAPVGRRARVLERYGNTIVSRTPNRTLSWLAGRDIERLTVVRPAGDLARVDANPAHHPDPGHAGERRSHLLEDPPSAQPAISATRAPVRRRRSPGATST